MWKNESNRQEKEKKRYFSVENRAVLVISLVSGLSHKNELEGFHGRQFWNPHNILELTEVIPRMVQKVKLLFGSRGVWQRASQINQLFFSYL